MENMRIYVASLSDYNNGRLEGKHFELSDYSDGSELMEAIQEMLDELTEKYKSIDGEVREEWAVHDYEGIPSTLASEYMGEQDFQQIYDIAEVAEDRGIPVEVLVERAGDTGSDDYQALADSLVMVVDGNDESDIVAEYEDQIGELGFDWWSNYVAITTTDQRLLYGEDVDNFKEEILYENPDMDESEAEGQAEERADDEQEQRNSDLIGYLQERGYENEFPNWVYKDYEDAWKNGLSYDFDVIHHDGEMYVFTNNYSLGGTILSGVIGAYIGYKVGRARPQKKGFSTEKRIGRNIKSSLSKKKYEHGGGVGMYDAHKANIKYLESISEMEKMKILKNIANHYGISVNDAEEEVTYDYAEYLYEYIANDSSLRMKVYQEIKANKMERGGGVSYNKNWEIIGITLNGKMFKERITLGRMSDKEDVKNALKRRTDLNIREITSIKEVFAEGGVVGQEITIDYQGDEVDGVIADIHNSGDYIVKLDDGRSVLAQRDRDIISFGDMAKAPMMEAPRKRFGFFEDGGKAQGVEWMKSDGQYEAELGDLYLIISPATERGLYFVKVKDGYRGQTIGESQNEIRGLDKAKDLAYKIVGDYYNQYGDGGGIGFKGLSSKVAKRYEGKKVAPKYQSQYGNTYSKSEAKEVGDKVAGKVYWNQQGRKMANGGGVDGYNNKSVEEIWNHWTLQQKRHFLSDHHDEFSNIININKLADKTFDDLKINYVNVYHSLQNHIQEGQYSQGGGVSEKITKSRLKAKLYKPTGDFFIEDKGDKWFLHFTSKDAYKNSSNLSDLNAKSVGNGYYGSAYSVEKVIKHKYAKGGMTEHGLEIGDEVMGYTKEVNHLHVLNSKNDEWHSIDLDDGKRYENGGGVSRFKEGDRVTNIKGKNGGVGFIVKIEHSGMALVDFVEEGKTEFMSLDDLKKSNQLKMEQGGGVDYPNHYLEVEDLNQKINALEQQIDSDYRNNEIDNYTDRNERELDKLKQKRDFLMYGKDSYSQGGGVDSIQIGTKIKHSSNDYIVTKKSTFGWVMEAKNGDKLVKNEYELKQLIERGQLELVENKMSDGGGVEKDSNYYEIIRKIENNERMLKNTYGSERVEKVQQEIQRLKDELKNKYGHKYSQGGGVSGLNDLLRG